MSSTLPSPDVLYEARDFPIFQNRMYATAAEARACSKGDIRLVQDSQTGIVCNQAFRPELMQYDAHYQNEQAVSSVFREHLASVATIIDRTMGRRAIVEVGCGKGSFLEMLVSKGFQVTGFDPTYEGESALIAKRNFDATVNVHANGIVLRHVLEHIQDPVRFLESLRDANGGAGLIYIEVPCFDWIKQHRAWFDIFYEHVNYFRLADFQRMFGRIEETGHLFGGQYLYVVADLASLVAPTDAPHDQVCLPPDFMRNLLQPAASSQQPAASSQQPAASSQQPAASSQEAIWGGASKGVIFALLRERIGKPVELVIDVNPAKQGQFLPGTGLEVRSPADALQGLQPGATIFVMNSNYLQEIKQMSNNAYHYIGVDHDGV